MKIRQANKILGGGSTWGPGLKHGGILKAFTVWVRWCRHRRGYKTKSKRLAADRRKVAWELAVARAQQRMKEHVDRQILEGCA